MGILNTTFYPYFGMHSLRSQRGEAWAQLVDHLSRLPASDPSVMALGLTVRRLHRGTDSEHTCHDPFCAVCAAQVVANFDGTESELIQLYYHNLDEIRARMGTMRRRPVAIPASITAAA